MGESGRTRPVPVLTTTISDPFWSPRVAAAIETTLPHALDRLEQTGTVANLRRAGGLEAGPHRGQHHADSDLFKVMEGLAWRLQRSDRTADPVLDELAEWCRSAQEPDGYLYTIRTLAERNGTVDELHPTRVGPGRWSAPAESHELYNLGHLFDLAAAHAAAVGPESVLVAVARRAAELVLAEFGDGGRIEPPGHQGIELGLVALADATGDDRFLALSRRLLDLRGCHEGRESYGAEYQDHLPVLDQQEAVGHAVRLAYMATAMTELGARTDDQALIEASVRLFDDVVSSKLYVTGGLGISGTNQELGGAFDLADEDAYTETCAAVAMAMWGDALCRATGLARYADVTERALHNGVASGSDLTGSRFYYPNPLATTAESFQDRSPWFATPCCPSNVARALPSLHRYVATTEGHEVCINQLIGSTVQTTIDGSNVVIRIDASLTTDPQVTISVTTDIAVAMRLRIRPPAWTHPTPLPSALYRYLDEPIPPVILDGAEMQPDADGYLTLDRAWTGTTELVLAFDLRPRRLVADTRAEALAGLVAIEYGPLVYCAESIDSSPEAITQPIADDAALAVGTGPDELGGAPIIGTPAAPMIPYAVRSNRGPTAMRTWMGRG